MGIAAALMTAFYSWRLIFMTFHGTPRATEEVMHHVHESPSVMLVPLLVLAFGSIFGGLLFVSLFTGHELHFWGSSILILPDHTALEGAHHSPFWVKILPIVMGVIGIALAWYLYIRRTDIPGSLARMHEGLYKFLLNKWYFDELYDLALVRPAKWLGRVLWKGGDGRIIDGVGPDGVAATVVALARRAGALQSGYLYHYAFAMLIGVALLVTFYIYAMGA
jgi:NADH-quinone oxidoreductase subunit L